MTQREPLKPRFLRLLGRLLATVLGLFYVAFLIGEGIADGFDVPDAETGAVVAVFAYAAASAAATWTNDRVGARMLVVASVALASLVAITAGRNRAIAAALIGGPFLLAGVALHLSAALHDRWQRERERGR